MIRRLIILLLIVGCVFAKDIIAVLELEQKGLTKQEAEILTDRLITKLISIGKYQVVERNNMDKILKEQKFQNSGCTDSECAVEIGQLLNTDFIVIGSVGKFGSTYSIDSRLIDVAQGKSLISAEFSKKGEIDVLLTTGITSIANQLCELHFEENAKPMQVISPPVTKFKPKSPSSQYPPPQKNTSIIRDDKKGDWYFSFTGLGSTLRTSNEDVNSFEDHEWLQIRYKFIQYKAIGYEIKTPQDILSIVANGIGLYKKSFDLNKIDYFLLPGLLRRFQNETLDLLNIPRNKRLSSEKYRHIKTKELIATDHPIGVSGNFTTDIQNIPIWIISWLKNSFINKKDVKKDINTKIYIERELSSLEKITKRSISNEEQVKTYLIKMGFSLVKLGEISFKEQANLFYNSECIIGLHGAAFANLAFCKSGTKIIELKSSTAGLVIENLAKKINLDYNSIVSEAEHTIQYGFPTQQGHIKVPVSSLKKILENN